MRTKGKIISAFDFPPDSMRFVYRHSSNQRDPKYDGWLVHIRSKGASRALKFFGDLAHGGTEAACVKARLFRDKALLNLPEDQRPRLIAVKKATRVAIRKPNTYENPPPPAPMRGIFRYEMQKGWTVHLRCEGTDYSKYFSDRQHGSRSASLIAAQKYRDSLAATFPLRRQWAIAKEKPTAKGKRSRS